MLSQLHHTGPQLHSAPSLRGLCQLADPHRRTQAASGATAPPAQLMTTPCMIARAHHLAGGQPCSGRLAQRLDVGLVVGTWLTQHSLQGSTEAPSAGLGMWQERWAYHYAAHSRRQRQQQQLATGLKWRLKWMGQRAGEVHPCCRRCTSAACQSSSQHRRRTAAAARQLPQLLVNRLAIDTPWGLRAGHLVFVAYCVCVLVVQLKLHYVSIGLALSIMLASWTESRPRSA